MAAPPDLINDPPSLICRYKDRTQDPISFSLPSSCSSPFSFAARHARPPRRERSRANVYFGLGASKREKGRPPPLDLPPSLSLSFLLPSFFLSSRCCSSKRHDLCSPLVSLFVCRSLAPPLFLDPSRRFITPRTPRGEPRHSTNCAPKLF